MFYVLYRDPKSLLVGDWKCVGMAPIRAFDTKEGAVELAKEMHEAMYYDVMIVEKTGPTLLQVDSRSRP